MDIRLGVRDLYIEDFQRAGEDRSPTPTLVVENRAENSVQFSGVSPDELQYTAEGAGGIEGEMRSFVKPDGAPVDGGVVRMRGNGKLTLGRGGIQQMAMNCETTGEK